MWDMPGDCTYTASVGNPVTYSSIDFSKSDIKPRSTLTT